jgi:ABC-type Fe3+ transport system permease subunit
VTTLLAIVTLITIATLGVVWLVVWHLRYCRHLTHEERMRALDAGQPSLPHEPGESERRYVRNASVIAFSLGMVFPLAAVCAAAWITNEGYLERQGQVIAVWCSVGAACLASVICSAVVMLCAAVVTIRSGQPHRKQPDAEPQKTDRST